MIQTQNSSLCARDVSRRVQRDLICQPGQRKSRHGEKDLAELLRVPDLCLIHLRAPITCILEIISKPHYQGRSLIHESDGTIQCLVTSQWDDIFRLIPASLNANVV